MSVRAKPGEIYGFELADGRHGACQVTWAGTTKVEVVTLDWVGVKPPRLGDLAHALPLRLDHHAHDGRDHRYLTAARPHWSVTRLGELPLVKRYRTRATASSTWPASAVQLGFQQRWSRAHTKRDRLAYATATHSAKAIEVVIAGRAHAIPLATWHLAFSPRPVPGDDHTITLGPDDQVAWTQLARLRALTTIHYTGADRGFLKFLRSHRMINHVRWTHHGLRRIDLRETGIETLELGVHGNPLELRLGRWVDRLHLREIRGARVTVRAPRAGAGLELVLSGRELPRSLEGLPKLSRLTSTGLKRAELDRLAPFQRLTRLSLAGAPGVLAKTTALARLAELREVELRDFYEIDLGGFPGRDRLPALTVVNVVGLRELDVRPLNDKLGGLEQLTISGGRGDAWIRANMNNPFRHWGERAPRFEKAARRAFAKALAATTARPKPDRKRAEEILHAFIAMFNAIDLARARGLGVAHRDDVYEAMHVIGSALPAVTARQLDDWFAVWAEF